MPISFSLIIELFIFGFALWLGAYLLARDSQKNTVRLTGLGLVAYAIALAVEILFEQIFPALVILPSLLWIGAALYLQPEETQYRDTLIRIWVFSAIPILILSLVNIWVSVIVVLALLTCAVMVGRLAVHSYFRNALAVIAVITLLFTLSTGLVVLPLQFVSSWLGITLLGLDLLLLGLAVVIWDAFDEGENLRLHILRSFVSSFYYAGALAVLVLIAAAIEGSLGFGKLLLLVSLIAFGILTQTFSNHIQNWLDVLTFPRAREMNQQRELLLHTLDSMPRLSTLEPLTLSEEEFTRLTRRALSNLGDLPHLSTSPLVHLPQVGDIQNPLERAQRLKTLLAEHIQRLKPNEGADFGVTDAWRYYNALYFPYVAGLKPYTLRQSSEHLDETFRKVLDWFQTSVPERTLHNWQNSAAKLVAKSLRNAS